MQAILLNVAAFVAGCGTLALELTALRMLAPHFGSSAVVTGTVVTTVLVCLTIGCYAGGIAADRRPEPALSGWFLLVAGAWVAVGAWVYRPVLGNLEALPWHAGPSLATGLLFGVPSVALAMVAPFVVRLTARAGVGLASGRVSAVGTAGAIVGSLATTFWLIPTAGVLHTLVGVAAVLVVGAVVVLWATNRVAAVALALPVLVAISTSHDGQFLYEKESIYNHIRVRDDPQAKLRVLSLNQSRWTQSVTTETHRVVGNNYYHLFNTGPLLAGGADILILGMGAGTSALELLREFPAASIDAVEIDPDVVDVAERFFGVPDHDPRLRVVVEDARSFVKRAAKQYDFIELDVYHGGPHVPYYLVTREAFAEMRGLLRRTGVLMINVISPQDSAHPKVLVDAVGSTLAEVFPSIYSVDLGSNHLVIGTVRKTAVQELRAVLEAHRNDHHAAKILAFMLDEHVAINEPVVLTDDLAPVETLTDKALVRRGSDS